MLFIGFYFSLSGGSWGYLQSLAKINSVCVLVPVALASNLYIVSVGSFCLSYCLSFLFDSHEFYSVESTDELRLCTPYIIMVGGLLHTSSTGVEDP